MNNEMSYLLGMICGNGEINTSSDVATVSIEIPHKKLTTEDFHDVKIYVKASVADIKDILEPLIGTRIQFTQVKSVTTLSFSKSKDDFLMREIFRYIGNAVRHDNMRVHKDVFSFTTDQKKMFLRGFCDVTGYMRRTNAYFGIPYQHRVYIEVPNNWFMVIDICNLFKDINIPVQNIDWAHPNIRDGNLIKYNQGNVFFWKKEHQIKIYANEFLPVGFGIFNKMQALRTYSDELTAGFAVNGKSAADVTHRFYWEVADRTHKKPLHPSENDISLPPQIRGKHYDSWKQIARDLGYGKQ